MFIHLFIFSQVVPHYMDVILSHRLLKRLLCQLMQHLRQKHYGLTRIYFVRDLEELISKPGFYHPLLMYREVRGQALLLVWYQCAASKGIWPFFQVFVGHLPYSMNCCI